MDRSFTGFELSNETLTERINSVKTQKNKFEPRVESKTKDIFCNV